MRLVDIPIDTLSEIASYLNGHEVCRLWLTSHRALQNRLCFAVKVFRLEFEYLVPTPSWPNIVQHFQQLEDMRLHLTYKWYGELPLKGVRLAQHCENLI